MKKVSSILAVMLLVVFAMTSCNKNDSTMTFKAGVAPAVNVNNDRTHWMDQYDGPSILWDKEDDMTVIEKADAAPYNIGYFSTLGGSENAKIATLYGNGSAFTKTANEFWSLYPTNRWADPDAEGNVILSMPSQQYYKGIYVVQKECYPMVGKYTEGYGMMKFFPFFTTLRCNVSVSEDAEGEYYIMGARLTDLNTNYKLAGDYKVNLQKLNMVDFDQNFNLLLNGAGTNAILNSLNDFMGEMEAIDGTNVIELNCTDNTSGNGQQIMTSGTLSSGETKIYFNFPAHIGAQYAFQDGFELVLDLKRINPDSSIDYGTCTWTVDPTTAVPESYTPVRPHTIMTFSQLAIVKFDGE